MIDKFETRTRRWREQRWLLDSVIAREGVDWDQPRTAIYSSPCGPEAMGDFQFAASQVRKFADMSPAYEKQAQRRMAKAKAFETSGRSVAARESYFIAAQLFACARWPVLDVNARYHALTDRLNRAFSGFIDHAHRRVERVDIPFGDKTLPAYLHLPEGADNDGPVACAVYFPGMDNNKEQMVAMYGDPLLMRGIAVLAVDGPGQAEALTQGVYSTPDGHAEAGQAIAVWLKSRPEIDKDRLAIRGLSFGSYFAVQAAAAAGGTFKGCVSAFVAHEPGLSTLFEAASPTFKVRFMMMSGHEDEDAFDAFIKGYDLRPWAEKLKTPVLFQAGEHDELSPVAHTVALSDHIKSPKRLVIYEGAKHVLRGGSATLFGENPNAMFADWIVDRFDGKPMDSRIVTIAATGATTEREFTT